MMPPPARVMAKSSTTLNLSNPQAVEAGLFRVQSPMAMAVSQK